MNLGAVQNVVVEPTLMDSRTDNYRFDSHRDISGWDEIQKFRIKVKNTRDVPVKVEIKRNFASSYWDIAKTIDYEKDDMDTVKFTLELAPRSNKEFSYELTSYFGVRRQEVHR